MFCWHNVVVGQLLHHHRDVSPWRPRRPGQRARARWEEVEEARGRKQSIFGQNRSYFCENNRQFRKLQFYQSVEGRICCNQSICYNQPINQQTNQYERNHSRKFEAYLFSVNSTNQQNFLMLPSSIKKGHLKEEKSLRKKLWNDEFTRQVVHIDIANDKVAPAGWNK